MQLLEMCLETQKLARSRVWKSLGNWIYYIRAAHIYTKVLSTVPNIFSKKLCKEMDGFLQVAVPFSWTH